jgi:hypothetical protein
MPGAPMTTNDQPDWVETCVDLRSSHAASCPIVEVLSFLALIVLALRRAIRILAGDQLSKEPLNAFNRWR